MSELHDKAQVLVLYFDGRAPVLTRFHDDPIDLAATIRDLLAENERLRADRDALHKMTRCQCSDDDACAFAVRAIAAEARLRELCEQEPVYMLHIFDQSVEKRKDNLHFEPALLDLGPGHYALIPRPELPK